MSAIAPAAPGQRTPAGADRVYLGWQPAAPQADPGPMPRRPVPPVLAEVSPSWLAAQRREERLLARPLRLAAGCGAVAACLFLAGWLTGVLTADLGVLGCAAGLAAAGYGLRGSWRGQRDLRARIAAEELRVAKVRVVQQQQLLERQEDHARQFQGWQQHVAAARQQPQWHAVSLPAQVQRLDVAGGTLAGWSALLTSLAVPRLAAGGEVIVVDLTEGAVAGDLVALARRSGLAPLVWVLPADLPALDLGTGLPADQFAEVLALTVSGGGDDAGAASPARDAALIGQVLRALGGRASIAELTEALRGLAQIGSPDGGWRPGLLSAEQVDRLATAFGREASERVVLDRAWELESRLRALDRLGSAPAELRPSRLRVAWLDRRASAVGNQVLGSYLTVALTHLVRQAPAGPPWQRTLCLLGAQRLGGDLVDRLSDACEATGTGLVLGYRSLPAPVRERLGRGNAAVAFMRLGNAEEARAAAEQIGTEHRFVLSQLTDTVGESVTDTAGDSYTSTIGTADSQSGTWSDTATAGRSAGRGASRAGLSGPLAGVTGSSSRDASASRAVSGSVALTRQISSSTSWGLSTSRAIGANASLGRTVQRSREFLVEQHELQQLPQSAVIVSYPGPDGRRVMLADANPAIGALPAAALRAADESGPGPNLGPPVARPDWRQPRP
jgi:hypothetical protein